MRVGLIWAQTPAGVIGADNAIPWRVPEDMAHFKSVTVGHPVVMGRRTWDSLPPRFRPLAERRNIVVTRQPDWAADGAERAGSLDEALALAAADLVWVMGGGEIYRAAMDHATELMVTEVDAEVPGDAWAPEIGPRWRIDSETPWQLSSSGLRYRWLRYLR
ncbi:dihydrofolate reductase [Nocardia terpenica]|uniref:Dihydrofolate reductase n=1 Tax=Nocardia terpenica TaxID=455432 RepID=A0A164JQE1_9NOCA|nr:dihydrofolate reductase [Nocardia terpenica]KZM70626.1 dihydrofolate reductase [Nocardia terpenica]MBF6060308.1 dihydrofolate reductase [Nocardia terpenica]MBF6103568.1 dihydrofolate reductase [Nocardia terpenica]MBF6112058.1 dihydrofolate reductase [Nocardia terpenica]MBF6117789.1 dihydrofolate reductase [Nocardia terpenica]